MHTLDINYEKLIEKCAFSILPHIYEGHVGFSRENVNTFLVHSIDIKPWNIDISPVLRQIYCPDCDFSGAFFEFCEN